VTVPRSERLYRSVLEVAPGNPDALLFLGLLAELASIRARASDDVRTDASVLGAETDRDRAELIIDRRRLRFHIRE
jgi:hypothetical protein